MSRAMESVDRHSMLQALYPVLLKDYDIAGPLPAFLREREKTKESLFVFPSFFFPLSLFSFLLFLLLHMQTL